MTSLLIDITKTDFDSLGMIADIQLKLLIFIRF